MKPKALPARITAGLTIIVLAVAAAGIMPGCGNGQPDAPEETNMAEADDAPVPEELAEAAATARQDLAGRLDSTPEAIVVREAGWVTWPDGSLGCPQPDQMYTQALVPGYRLVLEAGGQRYRYHGARDQMPKYCPAERAQKPRPDDTQRLD